jgi:glycosyltransferase involved in cell wall biosynthesis
MKIIIVIRDFWPLPGGLTLHTLRLAQELTKLGHTVEVVTRFTQNRFPGNQFFWKTEKTHTFSNEGITTHVIGLNLWERFLLLPLKKIRWRENTQWLAIKLVQLVFVTKFTKIFQGADIIHYEGGGLELMSFAALKTANQLKIPFAVQPSIHINEWGNQAIDHQLFRSSDRLFARTQVEKNYLVDLGIDQSKVTVVGSGFDDTSTGDADRFRQKYKIQNEIVLFLGRRSEDKGYFLLKSAFSTVVKFHSSVTFVFIGPGPDSRNNSTSTEAHCSRILELDYITNEERNDALAACDIFCVPSRGESFGLVFLEAARCKKPIIARNLEVLDELLGQYKAAYLIGERVRPGIVHISPEEIAQAILELLHDHIRASTLGMNAFIRSLEFLWPQIISEFQEAYQILANQKFNI